MKTMTRAQISLGLCLSLFCLGTSHANDTNNLDIKGNSLKGGAIINSNVNSAQKDKSLENFIQSAISGRFTYQALLRKQESKFTKLNANVALKNDDLFDDGDTSERDKLQRLEQMQKMAEHISGTYRVNLAMTEEIIIQSIVESKKRDLPPELVLSLISIESTFRPQARSHMGAMGLTQVIPKYHPEKVAKIGSAKNLHTVNGSIKVGVEVLREYLDRSDGNLRQALQRYNGSLHDKSQKYSNKVLSKMKSYQRFFES